MNVIVCGACSHPLCDPAAAIVRERLPLGPAFGFAYEFEGLVPLPLPQPAPPPQPPGAADAVTDPTSAWCYRLTTASELLLDTTTLAVSAAVTAPGAPQAAAATTATSDGAAGDDGDGVEGLIPALAPTIGKKTTSNIDIACARLNAIMGTGLRDVEDGAEAADEEPHAATTIFSPDAVLATRAIDFRMHEWFFGYRCQCAVECALCGTRLGWRFADATRIEGFRDEGDDGSSVESGFAALLLTSVRQRTWTAADAGRQCLFAAALARQQREGYAGRGGRNRGDADHDGGGADGDDAIYIQISRESPLDRELRRAAATLLGARVDAAVEDRVRSLKSQSELLLTLLEKHREQTAVLSQLLKGQKDKIRTQDDKLATFEQIFVAHKSQLETQTRHIQFQDELVKAVRSQSTAQQRQLDAQQRVLRDQNTTIARQNAHMKETQAYLMSLVATQVSLKKHLRALCRGYRDSTGTQPVAEGGGAGASAPALALATDCPAERRALAEVAEAAGRLLQDMAGHEAECGVDYSALDGLGDLAGRTFDELRAATAAAASPAEQLQVAPAAAPPVNPDEGASVGAS